MAPDMVALAGGYFEDEGLNVELQPVKGSPVAMQGVLGGVAPLTRVGGIDLMTAAAQGQELVNVGTIVNGPSLRIVSSDADPLSAPDDFENKVVGVPSEGGTSDKSLTLMLDNAGVDPTAVGRQVVGLTPGTFALVQQGQLGGYMVSIDTSEIVAQQNDDAVIYDMGEASKADTQVYTTTPAALEEHGEQIGKYLAAVQKAVQFMLDDTTNEKTIELLREHYSFATLDDDEVANAALDAAKKLWANDAGLLVTDTDRWAAGYEELVGSGLADSGGDPAAWVDNSYVE
jgi:NitT/TauT family transport system substrate-binding protein